MQPGDILPDRPYFPTAVARGRDQHREVGLAAGGGKRARQIVSFALRIFNADDQHVLGEPALGARLPARDAQRMAFLAEQGIAAVARPETHYRQLLREMHDETA